MSQMKIFLFIWGLLLYFYFSIFNRNKRDCPTTSNLEPIFRNHLFYRDVEVISKMVTIDKFNEILVHVNLIRPIGSTNHKLVREFIVNTLKKSDWEVTFDTFNESTVIGMVEFANIIATNNPSASRRIVLACHYESKKMANFYGTIDSAVPCSIIINIAESLAEVFQSSKADVAVQLIFFDGEEAFIEWTDADSIYGARHLAAKMALNDSNGCSELSQIDLFILLDLIGAAGHQFPRYPHCDPRFYDMLSAIEKLAKPYFLSNTQGVGAGPMGTYFSTFEYDGIQDDHIPFLQRGVPILHLIPVPFPPQWHKESDTAANIDRKAIHDIQLIVATFVCQYLQVSPWAYRKALDQP